MQKRNWNDLRFLLALRHHSRLAQAARALGVDATTVSRRLAALEAKEGRPVVRRLADGRLELTGHGAALAVAAERMDQDLARLDGRSPGGVGTVRLTAVPVIANRLLAPAVGRLAATHPTLRLDLIADARDRNLTRREADMALRFARPRGGGHRIRARRIATLSFAVYRGRESAGTQPWVAYDETAADLPQAAWIEDRLRRAGATRPTLRVGDLETALEAVAHGHGRTLLPRAVADRDTRLVGEHAEEVTVTREVWLLTPSELSHLDRISAVAGWIEDSLATDRL